MQDYKLGELIGTKTFGKGVVQSIYPLPDNGALKITTARYVTPLGRDIHHKGIAPDILVNQNPDPALIDTPKDQQLAAAKAYLKRTVTKISYETRYFIRHPARSRAHDGTRAGRHASFACFRAYWMPKRSRSATSGCFSEFYKKVDTQTVLDNAHDNLVTYLKREGVASPKVPALHASEDNALNIRALDREVEVAANQYHSAKFNARDLTYATISGMLGAVKDRYTVFLSPKDYADLNAGLDGTTFSGTGIVIQSDDTTKMITVSNVVPDGPADKAGVRKTTSSIPSTASPVKA